ncbi:MAG: hypothetical protein WCK51_12620 [Armatimonadota bacterium]
MTQLEQEFHELMVSIYNRAKSEAGYNATIFKKMLGQFGGLETAKQLLNKPQVSIGFTALLERKRLDLTVEAQLLANEKFWDLFTHKQIQTAKDWLRKHDYHQS